MTALVSGVYGYADYENMLPLLAELCGVEDTGRETLIPALIGWLYETEDVALPSRQVTPKSKRALARKRQSFGERLDRAMTLLGLSNNRLSALLNIDVSMVSRYRAGLYSPIKTSAAPNGWPLSCWTGPKGKDYNRSLRPCAASPPGPWTGPRCPSGFTKPRKTPTRSWPRGSCVLWTPSLRARDCRQNPRHCRP